MNQTLDIHDYYFGVIVATPEYLKNPKRTRLLEGVDYDPFSEIPENEALIFGVITLLRKEVKNGKEYYIDEYHSRYSNEIHYQFQEPNRLGIVLAYVKPFTDYYQEAPTWYCEEDIIDRDLLPYLYENHTYYISYSKKQNNEALIVLENYEDSILDEYLIHLLGKEQYTQMVLHTKELVKDKDRK